MPPRVNTIVEWKEKRSDLIEWCKNVENLKDAIKQQPFRRENEPPAQFKMLNALRIHYSKNASPSEEIKMSLYKCPNFDMESNKTLKVPTFHKGEYDDQATCIVDFANKVLGGGFLSHGFAQEERLCCNYLDFGWMIAKKYAGGDMYGIGQDEAIVIKNADFWCHIDFYGDVPDDWMKNIACYAKPKFRQSIIAIDCVPVKFKIYDRDTLTWILRKAYTGFAAVDDKAIATGHWGSGIFLNNKNTIFCVQCIAAAMAGKQLQFYAFGLQTPESVKGFELVRKWEENKYSPKQAFEELLQVCEKDKDFWTPSPHVATNRFMIDPAQMPQNPDFSRKIVHISKPSRKDIAMMQMEKMKAKKDGPEMGSPGGGVSPSMFGRDNRPDRNVASKGPGEGWTEQSYSGLRRSITERISGRPVESAPSPTSTRKGKGNSPRSSKTGKGKGDSPSSSKTGKGKGDSSRSGKGKN